MGLTTLLLVSLAYSIVMYFVSYRAYKRRNIELTITERIIRALVSGGLFFAIMYILGGMN